MALQKLVQTIGFDSSIKEQVDDLLIPNGSLRAVRNGLFDVDGAIRKRKGFTALSMTSFTSHPLYASQTIGDIAKVFACDDELVCFDDKRVFGYSPTLQKWALKCEHGSVMAERMGMYRDLGYSVHDADCVVAPNGIRCTIYTFRSADGVDINHLMYSSVYDEAHGKTIFLHKRVDGTEDCYRPRLILVDQRWFVAIYYKPSGGNIDFYLSYLDSLNPDANWSTPTTLATAVAAEYFDACAMTGDIFAISWYDNTNLNVTSFTHDGTSGLTYNVLWNGTGTKGVALDWDGDPNDPQLADRVHVAYYDDDAIKYFTLSTAMILDQAVTVASPLTLGGAYAGYHVRIAVKAVPGADKALVLWHDHDQESTNPDVTVLYGRWAKPSDGTLYGSQAVHTAHVMVTSRPFVVNDMAHVMVSGDGWYQPLGLSMGPANNRIADGLYLLRYDPALATTYQLAPRVVSQMALGEGLGMSGLYGLYSKFAVRQVSEYDGRWYVAQSLAGTDFGSYEAEGVASYNATHCEVFRLDPGYHARMKALKVGNAVVNLGGCPGSYDGEQLVELALSLPPMMVRVAGAAGGAIGFTGGGVFYYKVVIEGVNARGERVFSATTLEAGVTLTAGQGTVNLWFRGAPLTSRADWYPTSDVNLFAVVYRTSEDQNQVYYRVGRVSLNRWSLGYHTYQDTATDASIIDNEQIYTVGNELDSTALPSCSVGAVVDGRAWLRSDEFKNRLYHSKPLVPGRPPEFNHEFGYVTLPFDVYGIEAQQGTCIAIGSDSVSVIEGRGPGATGQGEQFQQRTIASGVGTASPMSVVATPRGTMFWSGKDWYLVNGKFALETLSDASDTTRSYPVIRDSVVVDDDTTVRFLCQVAGAARLGNTGSRILTFDWTNGKWSVHDPNLVANAADGVVRLNSLTVAGGVPYVGAGEGVFQESGYADYEVVLVDDVETRQAAFYPLVVETADLKTGNLDDFKRIWRAVLLLRRKAAHGFNLYAAYNGEPTYDLIHQWSETEITDTGVLERLRHHMKRQKAAQVRLKLEDTAPAAGGGSQGYEALGITLELGMKTGTLKFQKAS